MKYSFKNDYSELAHMEVLRCITKNIAEQNGGYGLDIHTQNAIDLIKKEMDYEACDIHFVGGGTLTNLLVISSCLKPYEGVICVDSGHINVHETGAIEGTGHKCLVANGEDGKITVQAIRDVFDYHCDEHMVKPKMVYISNSTEVGTIYSKQELTAIREVCNELGLLLFLDGARLGSALVAKNNDLTLNDLCYLTDVFYIGGTKNGAMIGEALILVNDDLKKDFRYQLKHRGALLAKGFLVGMQFEALFTNRLYFEIAKHQNEMALELSSALSKAGVSFMVESSTNQIFPILPSSVVEQLKKEYDFEVWKEVNSQEIVIRLVTSFNTSLGNVRDFCTDLISLLNQKRA